MKQRPLLVACSLSTAWVIGGCATTAKTNHDSARVIEETFQTASHQQGAAPVPQPEVLPPPPGNFGGWPMNTASTPLRFALARPGANQSVYFEVTSVQFQSGGVVFSTNAVPARVSPGAMYPVAVVFNPTTDGPHSGVLVVSGKLEEGKFSVPIALNGVGLCTTITAMCDPIGPLCLVEHNNESYDQIKIDPGPITSAAISRQFLAHNQPGAEYALPPSHLWKLIGLFDRLTEMPGDECSLVRFVHHANSRAKADVFWDYTKALVYRGRIAEENAVFTLTLPPKVRAIANVSNAYTELFFLDPSTSPTIEVAPEADPGHPIRKHAIKCISSTAFFASLRSHGNEPPIFVSPDE